MKWRSNRSKLKLQNHHICNYVTNSIERIPAWESKSFKTGHKICLLYDYHIHKISSPDSILKQNGPVRNLHFPVRRSILIIFPDMRTCLKVYFLCGFPTKFVFWFSALEMPSILHIHSTLLEFKAPIILSKLYKI